jgi:hypothetical protein
MPSVHLHHNVSRSCNRIWPYEGNCLRLLKLSKHQKKNAGPKIFFDLIITVAHFITFLICTGHLCTLELQWYIIRSANVTSKKKHVLMDWLIRLKSACKSLGPSFLRRCGDLWYRKANPQPCQILTRTQLLCAQARFSYGRSNARTIFIRLESHIWSEIVTKL